LGRSWTREGLVKSELEETLFVDCFELGRLGSTESEREETVKAEPAQPGERLSAPRSRSIVHLGVAWSHEPLTSSATAA
jgi:hypothetical protein